MRNYWPKQQSNLKLDAPIDRWDEAIPLGNGLLGALLWGSGNNLKVSLDRGDIWDMRDPGFDALQWNWQRMKELVGKGDADSLSEIFEKPNSEKPYPTKISVGRIEFDLPQDICLQKFSLDLATAHSQVDGGMIEAFVSAVQPVCMIRFNGVKPSFRIMPSGAAINATGDDEGLGRLATSLLGYPPPHYDRAEHTQWFLQRCAQDFSFAVITGARDRGDCLEMAITIATSKDGADPLSVGRKIIEESLAVGYDAIFTEHKKWWDRFWCKSHVEIPDQNLQQHYDICQYFYGAASRQGCPPIPLQGVWTADEGSLPPWKGDYHNDLNTQLTYWAYLSANRLEQGLSFLDFMWSLLPQFRDFAKNFYNAPGGCIPGVMSLDGKAMGGWHQYAYSPTNGGWVAHSFYMHWRYTMDELFLADRAYPFCKEIGIFIESLLEKDNNGRLKLPLSSSPEIHDNKPTAWLRPNSNYDLAIMRWLFPALNEMAERLGLHDERNRWNAVLDAFDNFAVDENDFAGRPCSGGAMILCPGETPKESHRHHSHLLAIYPLGLITIENSQTDRDTIFNSIRQLDHLGMQFWVGYSFAWMACLAARCGYNERALNMLELYLKGFVSRNGFHLNGDYKQLGLAAPHYRPFTLEGNFAAAQAVHEILLQSWGGIVRVFPSLPKDWREASFKNLRTEGAFLFSAKRKFGRTVSIEIVSEKGGMLYLKNPFGTNDIEWSHKPQSYKDGIFTFVFSAGDVCKGCV